MDKQVEKYFTCVLPEAEKQILFEQLDQNEALRKEFAAWQNVIAISDMAVKDDDEIYSQAKFREIMNQASIRKTRRIYLSLIKYAAIIILPIASWFISGEYSRNTTEEFTSIQVPKGQQIHITLADKSEVWLSSRSHLKIGNRFNKKNRNIELDGEAFFSIRKDTDKPFIVNTDKYDIKVTGTQFNVFAYSESPIFETDLVEGAISIYKEENAEEFKLHPKEKVFLHEGVLKKSTSSFIESYSNVV